MIQKIISKKTLFFTCIPLILLNICSIPNSYATDAVKEERDQDSGGVQRRSKIVRSFSENNIPSYKGSKSALSVAGAYRNDEQGNDQTTQMRRWFSYGLNTCASIIAFTQLLRFDTTLSSNGHVFLGTVGFTCALGALGINLVLNHL